MTWTPCLKHEIAGPPTGRFPIWHGEHWHLAGMKLTKLNTVFDYIACAEYLVDKHYTSPHRLAGEGISAGGIAIGGAFTWRPDLFVAAIDSNGLSDMLGAQFTPNGSANIEEFGSVATADGGRIAAACRRGLRERSRVSNDDRHAMQRAAGWPMR